MKIPYVILILSLSWPVTARVSAVADPGPVAPVTRFQIGGPRHRFPLQQPTDALPPLALARTPRLLGARMADHRTTVRFRLTADEALWGFGQRFDALNQRGRIVDTWVEDAWGGGNRSYIAAPYLVSSAGYGLFVNCTGRVKLDCGATDPGVLQIEVPDAGAEILVFHGSPAEVIAAYTAFVGRPQPVPDWVFGPWLSRNSYVSAYEIDRVIDLMEQHGLRGSAVVLEAWAENLQNFRFEQQRYPVPQTWIARLNQRGYRVVCWETPSIWDSASTYPEARDQGYLVLNEDGSELRVDWLENAVKIDFSNPAARRWWTTLHEPLVALGVAGFKTDGGERHPDPYFHNLHPYHYQRAALDAFARPTQQPALGKDASASQELRPPTPNRVLGDLEGGAPAKPSPKTSRVKPDILGITFARAASPPCAGNSTFWGGDQPSTWAGLNLVVRAGLSAGLSGFSFWGHDIGGYSGVPTKDLYLRWLQLGVFSPIMQLHGTTPREPWIYDAETLEMARWCFDTRWALQSYLKHLAGDTYRAGTPIWRPLFWYHPTDPVTYHIDDQFYLGDQLLVAPILTSSGQRDIYLPAGDWTELWGTAQYSGPTNITYHAALAEIPVFVLEAHAETWRRRLPARAEEKTPPLTMELRGETNDLGLVPTQRIVTGAGTEPITVAIRNRSSVAATGTVTVTADDRLDVRPGREHDYSVPAGKDLMISFAVNFSAELPADSYPVTISSAIATQLVTLVKLPDSDVPVTDDGYIDLGKRSEAQGFFISSQAGEAHLYIGSGDGVTVWLNDSEVFNKIVHRNPVRDEDAVTVTVKQGVNRLRVSVTHPPAAIGRNGFYLRIDR